MSTLRRAFAVLLVGCAGGARGPGRSARLILRPDPCPGLEFEESIACCCQYSDSLQAACTEGHSVPPEGPIGLCTWEPWESCEIGACGTTWHRYYDCFDLGTGQSCWPPTNPCYTYPYCGQCWCDVFLGRPCPCNCGLVDTDACHEAVCQSGHCVTVPLDCDDGDPCTNDSCDQCEGCQHDPAPCAPDCCATFECPVAGSPNTGQTAIFGEVQSTLVFCLPPEGGDPPDEVSMPVVHRIVTHDTPRARDLHGMLRLSYVSGDASVVDVRYLGAPYALGSPIQVVESGHSGCDVHTWHEGVEMFPIIPRNPGQLTLKAQVDPDPECCEGDGGPTVEAEIQITVVRVDLDVDANRDGSVVDDDSDDVGEGDWAYGAGNKGAIILSNNDDDDGNGVADNAGATVDGPADAADLAPLLIRGLGADPGPGWSRVLEVDDRTKIRVFDQTDAAVLGPESGGDRYTVPGPLTAGLAYQMEATQLPGGQADPSFGGLITLRLILEDPQGVEQCSDTVVVRVAPFILLPPTGDPHRVLVADADSAFVGAIEAVVGASNLILADVSDVWTQDAWELGFSSVPGAGGQPDVMPIAFETLRAWAGWQLHDWGRTNLLGPVPADPDRTGLSQRLEDNDDEHAYGGNLEVTPPLPGYPLGRIIVGSQMPQVQKDFLVQQGRQAPLLELDTGWLDVGHIDEFMAIIPGPVGSSSWDVVVASPA